MKNKRIFTDDHKLKLRLAKLGRKQSPEQIQKRASKIIGRKYSEDHRRKISLAQKGIERPYAAIHIQKYKPDLTGKKHLPESILKMKASHLGQKAWNKGLKNPFPKENHWNWKGGVTKEEEIIRKSNPYKEWRKSVFSRDEYTCVVCKKKGGTLQADHIKPFALYPELRLDINNGRTLCLGCHKQTDTYGGKTKKIIKK